MAGRGPSEVLGVRLIAKILGRPPPDLEPLCPLGALDRVALPPTCSRRPSVSFAPDCSEHLGTGAAGPPIDRPRARAHVPHAQAGVGLVPHMCPQSPLRVIYPSCPSSADFGPISAAKVGARIGANVALGGASRSELGALELFMKRRSSREGSPRRRLDGAVAEGRPPVRRRMHWWLHAPLVSLSMRPSPGDALRQCRRGRATSCLVASGQGLGEGWAHKKERSSRGILVSRPVLTTHPLARKGPIRDQVPLGGRRGSSGHRFSGSSHQAVQS